MSPELVVIISYSTGALIALGYFLLFSAQVSVTPVGVGFAVAAGVASGIGSLLYYIALKLGDVGVVSTLTGLYFVKRGNYCSKSSGHSFGDDGSCASHSVICSE
ncbi:MAG: hypothetical protein ABEI86_12510 [Halobacteriaceae archaeon]